MYGGFILIEVCDANPAANHLLFDLEDSCPGVSVMENSCMSECELCAARPYVFFNGDLLSAPSLQELLALVRGELNQLVMDDTEI